MKLPKARNKELVVQELSGEILVYDLISHKAFHLNKIAGLVWKNCDGKTSFATVIKLLKTELNTKIEEDFVWLALNELEKSELLEEKINKDYFTPLNRRKVLLRYALPAIAFPVIMALAAPQAVSAQSCIAQGGTCLIGGVNCCPGLVCVTGGGGPIEIAGVVGPGVCVSIQIF